MSMRVWIEQRKGKRVTSFVVRWRDQEGGGGSKTFREEWRAVKLKAEFQGGQVPTVMPSPEHEWTRPQIDLPGSPQTPSPFTWAEFSDRYWGHMRDRLAPRSLVRYQEVVAIFEKLAQPTTLAGFSKLQAVRYLEALSKQKVKGTGRRITRKTVNDNIRIVKSAFILAVRWGLIPSNPFDGIGKLRETDSRGEMIILEVAEVEAVEARCSIEFKPLYGVLVRLGLRRGELLALRADDLDRSRRLLRVNSFKTATGSHNRYRYLPLSDKVLELLAERVAASQDGLLFPLTGSPNWPRRQLRKAARLAIEAGLLPAHKAGIRLHDLRHTYSSHLLANGGDLRTLMYLLGHNRIETTQRYLHPLEGRLAACADLVEF